MYQCLTWDGRILAALEIRGWRNKLYHFQQPNRMHSFPPSKWGMVHALALSAPEEHQGAILDMLESMPFDEFLEFYRKAVKAGLIGKSFAFYLMVVLQGHVVGVSLTSGRCLLHCVERDAPLAIGAEAAGVTLLMDPSAGDDARGRVDALHAGGLQFMMDNEHHFVRAEGIAYEKAEVGGTWEHCREDSVTSGLYYPRFLHVKFGIKDLPCVQDDNSGATTRSTPGNGTSAAIS
jgi:hypothetical protein